MSVYISLLCLPLFHLRMSQKSQPLYTLQAEREENMLLVGMTVECSSGMSSQPGRKGSTSSSQRDGTTAESQDWR